MELISKQAGASTVCARVGERPVRPYKAVPAANEASVGSKRVFPREQLGNSRSRSDRVVGCRFVFAAENRTHSDRTRLTRRSRPTSLVLNSDSQRIGLLAGTIKEQLAEKADVERDLQCPFRPSREFAPRLGQHAERADGMEHSKRYVLCPPDIHYQAGTRTRRLPECLKL
jgi:hypothetical protein